MLALRLLATKANLPVGSTAIQQAAVPPSATSELIGFRWPLLVIMKDDSAPAPPLGMLVAVPNSSVTSRRPFLSNAKPKKLGSAGPGACVIVGASAVPSLSTGKT